MHKVYKHGLCTVAAAASSDSNSGLFWERKQPPLSEMRLQVGATVLQVVDAHIVAAEVGYEVLQAASPPSPSPGTRPESAFPVRHPPGLGPRSMPR